MIHKLLVTTDTEDYIKLQGNFAPLSEACTRGELQFIDKKRMKVSVSLAGGLEIPDILMSESLICISKKCKETLDKNGIDYLFYKEILVESAEFSIHETFYLLIVPKIDCISLDSIPETDQLWDYHDGFMPMIDSTVYHGEGDFFAIDNERLGRYELFRIFGLQDDSIYVTDKVKMVLENQELEGIQFLPIKK